MGFSQWTKVNSPFAGPGTIRHTAISSSLTERTLSAFAAEMTGRGFFGGTGAPGAGAIATRTTSATATDKNRGRNMVELRSFAETESPDCPTPLTGQQARQTPEAQPRTGGVLDCLSRVRR